MPFESSLPEWNVPGQRPPDSKINQGWGVEEHPPADWFNWQWYLTYLALKSLVENAQHKEEKGKANGYAELDASGRVLNADGSTAGDISSTQFNDHLAAAMPHKSVDSATGKTYRWGLGVENGNPYMLYEEVL